MSRLRLPSIPPASNSRCQGRTKPWRGHPTGEQCYLTARFGDFCRRHAPRETAQERDLNIERAEALGAEPGDICPCCEIIGLPGALCPFHAAASEMLNALQAVEDPVGYCRRTGQSWDERDWLVRKVQTAIAKAEGRL